MKKEELEIAKELAINFLYFPMEEGKWGGSSTSNF